MSFSYDVKRELCGLWPEKSCCRQAELYGMLLGDPSVDREPLQFKSKYEEIARRFCRLLSEVCGCSARLTAPARAGGLFSVRLSRPKDRTRVLAVFGHTGEEPFLRINRANFEDDCCVGAFLRGLFLSCGSVTDPHVEHHLEYAVGKLHLARDLSALLAEYRTRPKLTTRRGASVVYYKESEAVEDALTMMQAVRSSLALMDVKIEKDLRNKVNRATNCETANLTKSLEAGRRQLEAIALLERYGQLPLLPDQLRRVAELRRDNPEASLSELGQMLPEPLSRSGVNHRLNKVLAWAERVAKEKERA